MRKIIAVLALLFVAVIPRAQNNAGGDYKDIKNLLDIWIEGTKDFDKLPGIAVAVVKDQEIIYSRGFGFADVEKKVPMKSETIFSICSISKLFTAVAIMQLVEQGKLHLDDSISAVLPSFNLKQQYPGGGPITIRSVLTHSSGMPRDSDYPYWSSPDFSFPTEQQVNEKMASQKTVYPANRYFQYSNLGITVLGEIVAHISKMPYDEYVLKNILQPLRLANTLPNLPEQLWGSGMAKGYSSIHRDGTRELMPFFQAKGIAPAAGYSSNVGDLCRFASWQFRLLHKDSFEILKSSTLRTMHNVHFMDPDWKTSWGLGFKVNNSNSKTVVGHNGSCPGYQTSLSIFPEDTLAIVVMVNGQGVQLQKFTDAIYNTFSKYKIAAKAPAVPDIEKYLGSYDAYAWSGETVVVRWKDGIALMALPSNDPTNVTVLKFIEGDTFSVMRPDGKPTGMRMVFQKDGAGKIISMTNGSTVQKKIL